MPVFKVQAPDGMIIKVEADDEATAIRGAREHYVSLRSQPPKATRGYQEARATVDQSLRAPAFLPPNVREFVDRQGSRGMAAAQGAGLEWTDEAAGKIAGFATTAANALGMKTGFTPAEADAATRDAILSRAQQYSTAHPVENMAMKTAGGLTTGGVGGKLIQSANTLRGAVGASAGVGAAYGAVTGAGASENGQRGRGAAIGAGVGGAIGAAAPIVARGAQMVTSRFGPVDEAAAMQQADEALQEVGVNIRTLSQPARIQLRDAIRRGRAPREAAMGILSTTDLPVPVPMTRGDRSGAPGQQLTENLMERGARGSAAARQMSGIRQEQQVALRGNVDAITSDIAGGQTLQRGQGAQMGAERLNTLYDQADAGVNSAYEAARRVGGDAMLPSAEGPRTAMLDALTGNYDLRNVERVAREVERFGEGGAPTVRELFDARTRISNLSQSADAVEAGAARSVRKALDGYIDTALTDDLFLGDPQAVAAWKAAVGSRREFGRMFESGDLIEKLTERTMRGGGVTTKVDPNDAANYILGRADLGFVGRQNLDRDLTRLRSVLGADSGEWNAIRGEIFMRLASTGEGGMVGANRQFSGVKFAKAWSDLQRKDPRLAASLFSTEERALIDRFSGVAARVTSSVRGGDNPSNTAVSAMRLLGNLRFLRGVPGIKSISDELEVQVNLSAARAATSPNFAAAPRPMPTGNPLKPRVNPTASRPPRP